MLWRRANVDGDCPARRRLELMEAAGEAALVLSKAWGRWRAACGAARLLRQQVSRLQASAALLPDCQPI